MRTIRPLDIPGLDLVLGGGLCGVVRAGADRDSGVVLIRGEPGTGKTVCATQIAGQLARSLGGDVAYGCVELLPEELAAQHLGLARAVDEQVVTHPFATTAPGGCRIFAATLDLDVEHPEAANLGAALEALLGGVEAAGGRTRVLVIDSLSEGYRLGGSLSRVLIDAVCKFAAQRGLFLVLIEEAASSRASAWSFAADTVLELRTGDEGLPELLVAKHRFGPADRGPHGFAIERETGVRVWPRPAVYLQAWARALVGARLPPPSTDDVRWPTAENRNPTGWPLLRESAILCHGNFPDKLASLLERVRQACLPGSVDRCDLFVTLHGAEAPRMRTEGPILPRQFVYAGDPGLDGARFLDLVLGHLTALARERPVGCVVVGDLSATRTFRSQESVYGALAVLRALLRRSRVPLVLFESNPYFMATNSWAQIGRPPVPRGGDLVDVVVWSDQDTRYGDAKGISPQVALSL